MKLIKDLTTRELKRRIKKLESKTILRNQKKYLIKYRIELKRRERAETEIINSPFSKGLGWIRNGELTKSGEQIVRNGGNR